MKRSSLEAHVLTFPFRENAMPEKSLSPAFLVDYRVHVPNNRLRSVIFRPPSKPAAFVFFDILDFALVDEAGRSPRVSGAP